MKRIISGILALALVFGAGAALPEGAVLLGTDFVASAETLGDYKYTVLDDGMVEITEYIGSDEEIVIPGEIDGKKVTSIGSFAFAMLNSVSITIPDGITSIGTDAFFDCESLTSIVIPNSVTSIGDSAFFNCISLTSITIPNGVKTIGKSAFSSCYSLKSVSIPNTVTSIGSSAFFVCTSLTSIVIPDSVTSIGDSAFFNCTSLTSIVIPDSVTSIGDSAIIILRELNHLS